MTQNQCQAFILGRVHWAKQWDTSTAAIILTVWKYRPAPWGLMPENMPENRISPFSAPGQPAYGSGYPTAVRNGDGTAGVSASPRDATN
jgi:hypothetical protein